MHLVQPQAAYGVTVTYAPSASLQSRRHEDVTLGEMANKLALLLGRSFAGEFEPGRVYPLAPFFVPADTLDSETARRLGIRSVQDLFGGVVPHPFVAMKTITHPLIEDALAVPDGWCGEFSQRVDESVLPGWSAFSFEDAQRAGAQLLAIGAVRVKRACGIGGLGQGVVASERDLDRILESIAAEEMKRAGVVLEPNLTDVRTYSVGQVYVAGLLASYWGTQRLTTNHRGEQVYGGSRLTVVRGGFEALAAHCLDSSARIALAQARTYHCAAKDCFPGFFASRCNYDVAQGVDSCGVRRSGVLEQSWRIGGASGAELLALAAFQRDPALNVVCVSTREVYASDPPIPDGAFVYFNGIDERIGPMAKYAAVEAYGDSR